MIYKSSVAVVAACLALSACSSGSGSSSNSLSPADVAATEANYNDYVSRIGTTMVETSPTGTASMSGVLGVSGPGVDPADSTATVVGKVNMAIDFGSGNITSGSVNNFAYYSGDPLAKDNDIAGSLDVTGTVSGSGLTANAAGTLSDSYGSASVDLGLTGTFYTDTANADTLTVVGDVSGTVDNGTDPAAAVTGNFYATQN